MFLDILIFRDPLESAKIDQKIIKSKERTRTPIKLIAHK